MVSHPTDNRPEKTVILLSGGLDSATVLYQALKQGHGLQAITFTYGQRHSREVTSAQALCAKHTLPLSVISLDLPWKGSSLLDSCLPLPQRPLGSQQVIPSTYVPARNLLFLSYALSLAEATGSSRILIGANAVDYSGYPDCRPEFFESCQQTFSLGTKTGVEGQPVRLVAPLLYLSKAQIVRLGVDLGLPFHLTWSCYSGGEVPCARCESCVLRQKGFSEAGIDDPLATGLHTYARPDSRNL
jgi:7-cyano-7-deazaguanine synthase